MDMVIWAGRYFRSGVHFLLHVVSMILATSRSSINICVAARGGWEKQEYELVKEEKGMEYHSLPEP